MNMHTIKTQLFKSFMDKEKRDLFVSQNIGTTISAQLFSMREKKDWTQEELAQKTEMAQARISVLENPNYENFSIKTLKRLASAFDVGLMVRFVSFGELAEWVSNLSPEDLAVPDFEHESRLQETKTITTVLFDLASFGVSRTKGSALSQIYGAGRGTLLRDFSHKHVGARTESHLGILGTQ